MGNKHSITTALILLAACASASWQNPPLGANAACCYFAAKDKDINQPGQKAFISWNPQSKTEAFTVQPKFEGNAADFGMVIPTPSRPKLDEMPRDFFKDLAIYTILMPLPQPIYGPDDPRIQYFRGMAGGAVPAPQAMMGARPKSAVRVLESGVVGSLDYKIIVAEEAKGLFDWLKENKYSYGGDESTLNFYIQKKWFFTVMKIDPKQMKKGSDGAYLGEVTPTRFTFSSEKCIYPLKITQISVKNKTDALFYVQAPQEMDLAGDCSWRPSYRSMYITYLLGCGAGQAEASELQQHTRWIADKKSKDPQFETAKLEWAKHLEESELNVLEDPLKNYGQAGTSSLPPGAKSVPLSEFMKDMQAAYAKHEGGKLSDSAKETLARWEDQYQPSKGMIVRNYEDAKAVPKSRFGGTKYSWYPAREAPQDEVKNLSRLKGHLQKGQWLTKFRKQLRKEEMTDDLLLVAVPKEKEQTYSRIMPTSPP
ncbi:MAG: DUF2330 domain-containing protein [Candidatus Obscuribacterales bacterium]|nr:DUF2330 domain-containing protein [Candidatus Obscuribacterales bacterium]